MLLVGGCGGGSDDNGGDSDTRSVDGPAIANGRNPVQSEAGGDPLSQSTGGLGRELGTLDEAEDDYALDTAFSAARKSAGDAPGDAPGALGGPAIIFQGSVSTQSDDVQQARFDTMDVMDKYGGTLAADETATGDDGKMKNARMLIRVPSKDFEQAYADLQKVGDNVEAHSGSEDVTTEVIDVEARIRAQEQSLARIEALLAQAQRLRTIIAIESQLSRRQADLDSLKSRQAYLADQTSEATIAMHIERTPDKEAKEKEDDDKGFLAGLNDGWDGLVAATVGIATVIGVLLPFAVVLGLIGYPLLVLIRRLRPVSPVIEDQPSA